MKRLAIPALLGLVLAVPSLAPKPAPAPVAGPGGVLEAVRGMIEALDKGDAAYFGKAFVRERHGFEFAGEKNGEAASKPPATPFELWDRASDGTSLTAESVEQVVASSAKLADAKLGRPKTTIERIYADCPSGECSYAVVEFTRAWGEGKDARTMPMRASVLVNYQGDATPHFRVFHWHAAQR